MKDFNKSEYYEHYLSTVSRYQQDILIKIMDNNDNEIWYTRNDVLKLVFKFCDTQLREFPESLDVNPTKAEQQDLKLQEAVKRETEMLLWDIDIS